MSTHVHDYQSQLVAVMGLANGAENIRVTQVMGPLYNVCVTKDGRDTNLGIGTDCLREWAIANGILNEEVTTDGV